MSGVEDIQVGDIETFLPIGHLHTLSQHLLGPADCDVCGFLVLSVP